MFMETICSRKEVIIMTSGKQEKKSTKKLTKFLHSILSILKEILKIAEVLKAIIGIFQ